MLAASVLSDCTVPTDEKAVDNVLDKGTCDVLVFGVVVGVCVLVVI